MKVLFAVGIGLALAGFSYSEELITWTKLHLDSTFYSEGASIGDVNRDGKTDVLSGPFAWLGPDFEKKIEIYKPVPIDPKGYSNNFLNFTSDFNGDGWIDYLVIGFPGKESRWYENPKEDGGDWPVHVAMPVTDNESPGFADLTGDGKPEIICSVGGVFGYASPDPDNPTKPFTWHPISPKSSAGGRFTHGLGVGDVDGDRRLDLLEKGRWWKQPDSLDGDPEWKAIRTGFIGGGGAQMFAYDFDGDGDNDVLTSLNAHGYGLAWHEQLVEDGEKTLEQRLIIGDKAEQNRYGVSFSQMHGVTMADIDDDGLEDVITGKRYWAHGGRDPGGNDPAVLYWFETIRKKEGGVEFIPHRIHHDSGVGCQVTVADVNGDSFPDIIVGNKKGTFIHLQKRKSVDRETWLKAQPRSVKKMARLVRETDPLSPEEELKKLEVPTGFEIGLFAAEPVINKPINLAVDQQGRVWVSSTVEYPFAAEKERWLDSIGSRVQESRDAIKILEDTDGDGRADRVIDFADGLNIPTGVLPWSRPEHELGCIAWSIPNIWYFADTTGDGEADFREVLFGPLGYEKDTHGMCSSFRLGPGEWVYATHGFNNTSTIRARDGSEITLHSGNVFRFRPDASRVELWSGGQVNPFGLAFDSRGNLYSADCHSSPVYQLLRGATYPHFGKAPPGIGFGPTMIQHTHGSTGICGIVYLDRDRWGAHWNDHVLIGNPVNSIVHLDKVAFTGTTPTAIEQPEFLISDDPWFRPVDLCFGKEGELYVADFYNRIIGHYEVPRDHPGRDRERGRIWRITKKEGVKAALPPVAFPKPLPNPIASLADDSPFVQREAAAQLQLHPDLEGLQPLLDRLTNIPKDDTHLRHVVQLALRETLKLENAFSRLKKEDYEKILDMTRDIETEQSANFIAFQDLIDNSGLTHITRFGNDTIIKKSILKARTIAGSDIKRQHGMIDAIQTGLFQRGRIEPEPALLEWATDLAKKLLAQNPGTPAWTELPQKGLSPWTLQPRPCTDQREAMVLSSLRRGDKEPEQRTGEIRSKTFPAPPELSFWICGHRGHPSKEAHQKNFVSLRSGDKELFREYPPRNDTCRKIIWETPSDLRGKPIHLHIVDGDNGPSYAWLGITRIEPPMVSVNDFSNTGNDETLQMLAEMLKVTAPVSLRDQLRRWLPLAPSIKSTASPEQQEATQKLIDQRIADFAKAQSNPDRGQEVFTQHCSACHQVQKIGGLTGPQLDGVGSRGVARLCEDILDPNRNVDAHFRLTAIGQKDGTTISGFVVAEQGELIQLRDAAAKIHRVRMPQVKSRKPLDVSLMPPVFGDLISESEFIDLLAWLLLQ